MAHGIPTILSIKFKAKILLLLLKKELAWPRRSSMVRRRAVFDGLIQFLYEELTW